MHASQDLTLWIGTRRRSTWTAAHWKVINPPGGKKVQDFQGLWWEVYFCFIPKTNLNVCVWGREITNVLFFFPVIQHSVAFMQQKGVKALSLILLNTGCLCLKSVWTKEVTSLKLASSVTVEWCLLGHWASFLGCSGLTVELLPAKSPLGICSSGNTEAGVALMVASWIWRALHMYFIHEWGNKNVLYLGKVPLLLCSFL